MNLGYPYDVTFSSWGSARLHLCNAFSCYSHLIWRACNCTSILMLFVHFFYNSVAWKLIRRREMRRSIAAECKWMTKRVHSGVTPLSTVYSWVSPSNRHTLGLHLQPFRGCHHQFLWLCFECGSMRNVSFSGWVSYFLIWPYPFPCGMVFNMVDVVWFLLLR